MAEITITQRPAHVRHGSNIGQPLTRRDGVLKVTGQARYAADHHPRGMLYAVLAVSSIARGRVTFLDVEAAKAHPGVVDVITPANRPALAQDPDEKTNPFTFRLDLLQSDKVRYANQPIAVVVAETFEAATEGAALLSPRYDTDPPRSDLMRPRIHPPEVGVGNPPQVHRGDVEAGLAAASKQIEATYETASQYHNAMEPHAIVASWDGDTLSIDMPSQGLALAQARLAGQFGSPRTRFTSVAHSSAAATGPKASSPDRRFSASSQPGWLESRSSWCSAASKCSFRWDTGHPRGRHCEWVPMVRAS